MEEGLEEEGLFKATYLTDYHTSSVLLSSSLSSSRFDCRSCSSLIIFFCKFSNSTHSHVPATLFLLLQLSIVPTGVGVYGCTLLPACLAAMASRASTSISRCATEWQAPMPKRTN